MNTTLTYNLSRTCQSCGQTDKTADAVTPYTALVRMGGTKDYCESCLTAKGESAEAIWQAQLDQFEMSDLGCSNFREDQPWQPHYQDGPRQYTQQLAVSYED